MSVSPKSPHLNRRGSPAADASAWMKQSPRSGPAGRSPRPNLRQARRAARACPEVTGSSPIPASFRKASSSWPAASPPRP